MLGRIPEDNWLGASVPAAGTDLEPDRDFVQSARTEKAAEMGLRKALGAPVIPSVYAGCLQRHLIITLIKVGVFWG